MSSTQGLRSNPGHQFKGHHVPLGWCDCRGSSPALGGAPTAWFCLFFWWLWSVKSRATNHWNSCRLIVDCDGYSFALVANYGSFESPGRPSSIRVVRRCSRGQQCCLIRKPTTPVVDSGGRTLFGQTTMSFKWQLSLAPSNLSPDLNAPTRDKRKLSH